MEVCASPARPALPRRWRAWRSAPSARRARTLALCAPWRARRAQLARLARWWAHLTRRAACVVPGGSPRPLMAHHQERSASACPTRARPVSSKSRSPRPRAPQTAPRWRAPNLCLPSPLPPPRAWGAARVLAAPPRWPASRARKMPFALVSHHFRSTISQAAPLHRHQRRGQSARRLQGSLRHGRLTARGGAGRSGACCQSPRACCQSTPQLSPASLRAFCLSRCLRLLGRWSAFPSRRPATLQRCFGAPLRQLTDFR